MSHEKLPVQADDEINLLEYWDLVKESKKFISIFILLVTCGAALVSLFLPNIYKAEAVVLPIGGDKGGFAALASQVSGGEMLGGILGVNNSPGQKFVALLKTRTLAEAVIEKNQLKQLFYKDSWDAEKKQWKGLSKEQVTENAVGLFKGRYFAFEEDKIDGTIKIRAFFEDPKLAKAVVDSVIAELQELINGNSLTVAKRNRIFIESQLGRNKKRLLEVGKELNNFYQNSRISSVKSSIDVNLGLDDCADSSDSLECLKNNEVILEKKMESTKIVKDVPQQIYLSYLSATSELLVKMNALLAQQYEMAKIQEAKDDLAFQVIDEARVPTLRFKPNRRMIVMTAFIFSLFAAVFFVLFKDYIKKWSQSSNRA